MAPADRRFVGQNWLRGRCGLPVNKGVPGAVAAQWEYAAVCAAMERCNVEILTAGESPRPVGFRASELIDQLNVLHFVYVEPLHRRQGGGRRLAAGYHAHSAENAAGRQLGALAGPYVPYLWTYPQQPGGWALAMSSRYHNKQFLAWAEELSTL